MKTFENPILGGDWPDPSVLRMGDTFYMVNSSFLYSPGLLLWQSEDLVHWRPVKRICTEFVGNIWAPDLQYFNDRFYVYFPADGTNWVTYADQIDGDWAEPIDLGIGGIDPGFIEDRLTGERFLYLNDGNMVHLTDDGLAVYGEVKHVYDGFDFPADWEVEGPCLEGPKLNYHNGWYYLTCAQGGTAGPATSHMVISARSKTPMGPWENSPHNPVVHTQSSNEKWWSRGHGTLVEDTAGSWWLVYHAYQKDFLSMGRQVLLSPVTWTEDGWFLVEGDGEGPISMPAGGNLAEPPMYSDDFAAYRNQWGFYKAKPQVRYQNGVTLSAEDECHMAMTPPDENYEVCVQVETEDEGALLLWYNENCHVGLGFDGARVYQRHYMANGVPAPVGFSYSGNTAWLKIVNNNQVATLYYSNDGARWGKLYSSYYVAGFNHHNYGGFLSLRVALAAKGSATFRNFSYKKL